MRPVIMTVIIAVGLLSVTGGSDGSGSSQLETALSSQSSSADYRQHRLRHGHRSRQSARRLRQEMLDGKPLALPESLDSGEQVELEDGRRRYAEPSSGYSVCCPTVEERTSPTGGTLRDGSLAFLYTADDFKQVFFERSCDTQGGHPRRSRLSRRHYRCVQEHSYSYAVLNVKGSKVLDMIRIRSGCRCEIKHRSSRRRKKKRRDRRNQSRRRRRQRGQQSQTNARKAS